MRFTRTVDEVPMNGRVRAYLIRSTSSCEQMTDFGSRVTARVLIFNFFRISVFFGEADCQ